MKRVILISGKKCAGKSTLAGLISKALVLDKRTFQRRSFAGALKKMAIDHFGLTDAQVYGSDSDKRSMTIWTWEEMSDSLRAKFPDRKGLMTAREFMQVLGTDIFRQHFGKDVWVKIMYLSLTSELTDFYVIDDARFPNELAIPQGVTGIRIKIQRPGLDESDMHESERALDALPDFSFDYILKNDGSVAELENKASKLAEKILSSIQETV